MVLVMREVEEGAGLLIHNGASKVASGKRPSSTTSRQELKVPRDATPSKRTVGKVQGTSCRPLTQNAAPLVTLPLCPVGQLQDPASHVSMPTATRDRLHSPAGNNLAA